jgi:Reverse transcriptase (RNA-dependent DNA polymerase)
MLAGQEDQWEFLQAAVSFPILGIEFFKHFELLMVGEKLIPRSSVPDSGGGVYIMVKRPAAAESLLATASTGRTYAQVVRGTGVAGGSWFPAVVQPFTVSSSPKHGVQHHIVTTGQPVTAKFRRLDPVRLAAAKKEFSQMLAAGVIRRSSSRWASPLHMVKKKDGTWRPCGNFRRLNLITAKDRYPLPNMADLSARLEGCTIFSKLDLQKGYLQVPVRPEDIANTAIITPFCLFEFLRMPFGLRNAGMTFQRMMDDLFFDMPCVFVYLNDLLVASRSAAEHCLHLCQVLHQLQSNGLVINEAKCIFGQESGFFEAQGASQRRQPPAGQSGRHQQLSQFRLQWCRCRRSWACSITTGGLCRRRRELSSR